MPELDSDELDFHLALETERELKRLGAHPVREVRRLREEVRVGEAGTTMTLLVAGIGIGVWLIAAVILTAIILLTD